MPFSLLPRSALAGADFAQKMELGQFFQAVAAIGTLKRSFSIIVTTLRGLSGCAAVVNRRATFHERAQQRRYRALTQTGSKRAKAVASWSSR